MFLLDDFLDDTDGDGLLHVSHGESSEGRVLVESLNAHGFLRDHSNEGSLARLEVLGLFFDNLTGSSVDLALELFELTGDVSGVAVEHGGVSLLDLTGVVKDDDLSEEVLGVLSGVVLGVGGDVSSSEILDGEVLHVEANVVTGLSL